MAKQLTAIDTRLRRFIAKQKVFFVASAAASARVNLSPKGLDCLRVIDDHSVCYLDLTGSGSETAAHLAADGRLTLMFCAFDGPPMILRLYGRARVALRGEADYAALIDQHYSGAEPKSARQIVIQTIDLVQTSCGYAVPRMTFVEERPTLTKYWAARSPEQIEAYRARHNRVSIDGLPTGLGERRGPG